MYGLLALLPAATLGILIFEPPRLPLSYVFTSPESRFFAYLLSGLTIGSVLLAVQVARTGTGGRTRGLLLPGAALVGLAFAWGLIAILVYALGVLFLLGLSFRPSTDDACPSLDRP
jgi:hypothetical protein